MKLSEKYNNPDDITKDALSTLKNTVRQKAETNHSRYQSYLEMNPSLTRPSIYNRYIPTYKLFHVSRNRMVSHSLQIELGRQQKHIIPRAERLCTCGNVEDEKHFINDCRHYSHIRENYAELQPLPFPLKLDNYLTPDFIHDLINFRNK